MHPQRGTSILCCLLYFISQGGLYGIIVCGIKSLRVWFGPLPAEICRFQHWASHVMIWYFVLTLFFISLAKFMYICVWKHMRDMNDDLIVRILVRTAVFISIWVPTTGFSGKTGGVSDAMCIGVLNDYHIIMNSKISPEKLPQPYAWMFWSLTVAILFFMASAKIGRHQRNSLDDDTLTIIKRPKDLESMLLNFALLILLSINGLGYNLIMRK